MAGSTPTESDHETLETWPRKLNKVLIAIGVIAFGLIATDRLLEAFSADDPVVEKLTTATTVKSSGTKLQAESENTTDVASQQTTVPSPELKGELDVKGELNEAEVLVELENLFGSRVVFVSASEPVYVLTEDERKFEVGSTVNEQTTLAGVTAQQLILEKSGDLMIISLPDATVQ